jgi:hypothetical protein
MHILVASLLVALVACVLLLAAFEVFTMTPYARRIREDEQQRQPRAG